MRRTILALLAVLCCSCAVSSTESDSVDIDWEMIDNPTEMKIELEYTNRSTRSVCLSRGDWPNGAGKVNQMSELMYLVVEEQRFPVEDFNTGYCLGACTIRVPPGGTIRAIMSYEAFRLPEALHYKKKSLTYPITGDLCE